MATNPHIYVSSVVGTNTGATDTSQATQQTGNITSMTASDVYASISAAIAGAAPSDADVVYVCDNHAANSSFASYHFNLSGDSEADQGLMIVSVDSTNIDEYKPGASEITTDTGADFYFNRTGSVHGVSLEGQDNIIEADSLAKEWNFSDLTLTFGGGASDMLLNMGKDGFIVRFTNVDVIAEGDVSYLGNLTNGGSFTWDGGSYSGGDISTRMFLNIATNGGATMILNGVDISTLTCDLMATSFAVNIDKLLLQFNNCKLNSGFSIPTSGTHLVSSSHEFKMFGCDDATGDLLHRFFVSTGAGSAQNNDSCYVTSNQPWYEGSAKSSIKVATSSLCNHGHPFVFELPVQYVDLSSASTDKITINMVTDAVLTDTKIAAFLCYPDGTTAIQANWITSGKTVGAGNYGIDPLAAGTTLSTSALGAGDWTGEPASPNFYKMELDTSGDAGQATAVSIRIEIYYDFTTDSDVLYIDPILEVGT